MKVNLKVKRDIKDVSIRDIPIYNGVRIVSFKKFLVTSENGTYDDAVMCVYVNDTDALELERIGYAIIEKTFNNTVICRKKLGIHDVINGRVFIKYPFDNNRFMVNSVYDFVSKGGVHYYNVLLNDSHGIANGDYDCCTYASIKILNSDGEELSEVTDWFTNGEQNRIYVNAPTISAPERGYYIVLNFDQIIYNDIKDSEGREMYPGDWHFYSESNPLVSIKILYENTNINIPIGFSSDTDYFNLRQNEAVDGYYKEITNGVIPDFINTEKTKYIPYICSYSTSEENNAVIEKLNGPANRIEFYLHFRNRLKEVIGTDIDGSSIYGEMPSSSWSVETDDTAVLNEKTKFWNNFVNYGEITNSNENMFVGDLIGNLGFTDADVLNRKKKIKQSFIRLSFYNSNDPLQTSMLFYSTIFFDTNKLYSKYIKLYASPGYDSIIEDYLLSVGKGDAYNNNWGLVMFNGKPLTEGTYSYGTDELLTAEMSVSGENDRSSSAEGFNLYLFSDDSPKEDEERVIYMKVEFNHAGYGRKFPMILWPSKNGVPVPLTRKNFYEYLYIPVIVGYDKKNGKYFYYIKGANNDTENNVIKLALFEPKVEPV